MWREWTLRIRVHEWGEAGFRGCRGKDFWVLNFEVERDQGGGEGAQRED